MAIYIPGRNGYTEYQAPPEPESKLQPGQTLVRVLLSCKGKNFKKSHEEVKSGQVLCTMQRILDGDMLQFEDDMEELHDIPERLLPPHAQPAIYLELGNKVHEVVATISQDMYLGRSLNGAEPNRSMVMEAVVESTTSINGGGKLYAKVVDFGNFAKNTGVKRSAEEAFALLEESNSFSSNLRETNRKAFFAGLKGEDDESDDLPTQWDDIDIEDINV